MNCIPRGWVPVDGMEMTEDRGWDLDEIERRIRVGNLYDIINMDGRHIFESPKQHRQYMHLRKRCAAEYERQERAHAYEAGVPYRRCGNGGDGWDALKNILSVLWFIAQVLMIPFTLMGMRNGTQWFFGTGEYGGRKR